MMEEENYTYKSSYRFQVIPSCTLEISDFKKLYEILKTATEEGANIEISQLKKIEGDTEDNFKKAKEEARKLYKVSIQIFGAKGEYIFTESPSIFDDASLPDTVTKIIFDNTLKFKAMLQQKQPINKFRIEFDFTKQKVFDLISLPSVATPNKSFIDISGENETWVAGIYNKVKEFLQERTNKRGWLHINNIYDIFLWFLVVPLGFRFLYIINRSLPPRFSELSAFFKVACYLYFFILVLNIFRIIFNYARWIFPSIELIRSDKKGAVFHRFVLGSIILAILATFISDLVKLLLPIFFK